jgi:hypothetical protein
MTSYIISPLASRDLDSLSIGLTQGNSISWLKAQVHLALHSSAG